MKSRKYYFKIYRFSNIAAGVICLFLLLLGKSEQKNQFLFGYSFRIIILSLIMLAAIVVFLIATEHRAKMLRPNNTKSNEVIDSAANRKIRYGWFWFVTLIGIGLVAVGILLFVLLSTNSEFRAPLIRILPFAIFTLFFSLSSLVYLSMGEMRDQLLRLIRDLRDTIRRPLELLFFELIYVEIISIVFKTLITSIKTWDKNNSNHFIIIAFWTFVAASGLLIANRIMHFQGSKIRDYLRTSSGYLYVVFVLMAFLIFAIGHPYYGANDDYAMMSIASGHIDRIPDAHLVFTNIIIGTVLKNLYILYQGINWYSIYLIVVLFISSIALLNAIIYLFRGTSSRSIALIIFFIFIPRFFYTFNFTTIAMVACFAGIALLIKASDPALEKKNLAEIIFGISLIFISGLIRVQAMALVGLFLGPVILFLILKERRLRLIFPIGLSLSLALGAYLFDIQMYKASPEWSAFRTYNYQRGLIHDTPKLIYDSSQEQFWNQIGWQKSGFDLFKQWYFIDNQVFTLDSLKAINQEIKFAAYNPDEVLARFNNLHNKYQVEDIAFLVVLGLVLKFLPAQQKRTKTQIGLLVVYLVGIVILLAIFQRIPDHIYVPTVFIFSIYLLAIGRDFINPDSSAEKHTIPISLVNILLVGVLLLQTIILLRLDQANRINLQTRTYLYNAVYEEIKASPYPLVVIQPSSVPEHWVAPLTSEEVSFDYLPTGWLTNSPPYNILLKQHGIDNLIEASYSNPNIFLLGDVKEIMVNYLKDVKHINVAPDLSMTLYFPSFSDNHYISTELIRLIKVGAARH